MKITCFISYVLFLLLGAEVYGQSAVIHRSGRVMLQKEGRNVFSPSGAQYGIMDANSYKTSDGHHIATIEGNAVIRADGFTIGYIEQDTILNLEVKVLATIKDDVIYDFNSKKIARTIDMDTNHIVFWFFFVFLKNPSWW